MSYWFYFDGMQPVGPFAFEALQRLRASGIFDGTTQIKREGEETWRVYDEVFEEVAARVAQGKIGGLDGSFFYLDADRRPVGPVSCDALARFLANRVITAQTLIARQGEQKWRTASEVLGINTADSVAPPAPGTSGPQYRPFERYMFLMGVTLTFYLFYLIPLNSRDIKAITGRPRMEFTPLLFFGILSLGVLLLVMLSLWAFDLERHGNEKATPGRQQSLGTYVLALNILSLVLAFFSGGLALVLSAAVTVAAVWMLEKEINLYAKPPSP